MYRKNFFVFRFNHRNLRIVVLAFLAFRPGFVSYFSYKISQQLCNGNGSMKQKQPMLKEDLTCRLRTIMSYTMVKQLSTVARYSKLCLLPCILQHTVQFLQTRNAISPGTTTESNATALTIANIICPLILIFPLINIFCALALPEASVTKSSSEIITVASALDGAAPAPTAPIPFLRSRYQEAVLPDELVTSNWKTALT